MVIFDPVSGKEIYDPETIKTTTLNYCINLLTNREPKQNYQQIIDMKEKLHRERMVEKLDNDVEELSLQTYIKTLESLKKKSGNKYEFITKAGNSFHLALYNLYKTIWLTEKVPDDWRLSTLIQLSKPNSRIGDLDGTRFIHDRNPYMKFLGLIVLSHIKEDLIENMSQYQIACKPGHRPSKHLYVIKSVMAYYKYEKKGLIITGYDIKKMFDSELLVDCLFELYKCNVKEKL